MSDAFDLRTDSLQIETNSSVNNGLFGKAALENNLISPNTKLGGTGSQHLVFIDGAIQDDEILSRSFENADVFRLDPNTDGVLQITNILGQHQNLASVHIVSHGGTGEVLLGNSHLNSQNLSNYNDSLQSWRRAFTEETDLLFYGCNVGAGSDGLTFVQQLSQITGADIGASDDLTGNAALGGDWELEVETGAIESKSVLDQKAIAQYENILPIYNNKRYVLTQTAGTWTQAQTEAQRLGGNLVTINDAAEEAWLKSTFGTGEQLWIGLTDQTVEGQYRWINGEAVTYTNWAPGQPSNSRSNEDFVVMNSTAGQWNDQLSSSKFRAIVEIEPKIYNGNEYYLTIGRKTWDAAQAEAVSLGGNLVTINDAAEESWLRSTFSTTERFWLGINDVQVEGQFRWVSGETVTYTNWAPGEPNNYNGEEDHAVMNWNSTGRWNDWFATSQVRGIIEIGKPGVIGLQTSTITVNEAAGTVGVTVLRQQGTSGTVTVDYRTIEGSAKAGSDYTARSGTLTFAPGETSKSVTIPILDDTLIEGNETFGFAIDNVRGGATLLAPRTAQITIIDNERPPDLVGYWKLDEASLNAVVIDSSGLGNNGTAINMTAPSGPSTKTPVLNFANTHSLNFDGVNDYVNIPNQASLNLSGGTFTQSVWIHSENTDNGFHGVIGYQPAAGAIQRYPGIWVTENTKIHAGFGDGTNWNSFTTGSVLKPNAWNHVVTSFDGTTYQAYVNGQRVFSTTDFAGRKPFATQQVNIGRVDSYFKGQIDDARIYNRTLAVAEIQQLYREQPGRQLTKDSIVSGLEMPTAIEWTPDGETMLIAQKNGVVRVSQNGTLLATPFIDISAKVNENSDRGLLGLTIHPDFANNPYVYLLYTYDPPEVNGQTGLAAPDANGNRAGRLVRVTADVRTNYTTALANSEVVLLGKNSTWNNFNGFVDSTANFNEPPAGILPNGQNLQDFLAADSQSHSVGMVKFGPDGALYVTNGDGTSYNRADPRTVRVQDIDNLSGKVLRIDPITGKGLADNPFYDGNADSNRSKVYQYGLRNPFRFSIHPETGQLYIGDVGWGAWEEINTAGPGANFGWPYYEGGNGVNLRTGVYESFPEAQAFYASGQTATPSILALNHATDGINAIVVGDVYTGTAYPDAYNGDLFFNDLGQGIVRNVSFNSSGGIQSVETFATGAEYVVQIVQGPDGNLYYVDLDDGVVGRWRFV
ncbi:DUF4347 domain-containing protein [Fortiea contorta]|uniref:DUF4347 domain-containing protein n=1 Tax=Fortiea contorta TaxID=1892405 RepID=UPI000348D3F3|nr:DUF4347 domain-containing protein [Fortiea contorta]